MIQIILGVLALLFVQTLVAPAMQYLSVKGELRKRLWLALGPRDHPPPRSVGTERADRALRNLFESLPVFLGLSLLSLILKVDEAASLGAAVFLFARLLYVPAYMSGIPELRSLIWTIGLAGLVLLAIPVVRIAF